jgi:hypothetical protein
MYQSNHPVSSLKIAQFYRDAILITIVVQTKKKNLLLASILSQMRLNCINMEGSVLKLCSSALTLYTSILNLCYIKCMNNNFILTLI